MSQENVEILRNGFEAFSRRDRAAWLALCDRDYETVPSDDWPELEPIRGAEAAWDFYVEADEPWEGTPYEYVEVIDAGGDNIVAHLRREMRGRASGVGVVYSYWVSGAFRDGKVRRIQWFTDRSSALEAVGLSEQDAHADS